MTTFMSAFIDTRVSRLMTTRLHAVRRPLVSAAGFQARGLGIFAAQLAREESLEKEKRSKPTIGYIGTLL